MKTSLQLSFFILFFSVIGFSQNGLITINFSNNIILPGGNYIVKDPLFDEGALTDIGIVSLYDGATNQLISQFKGPSENSRIGGYGIAILPNNDFLILSDYTAKRVVTHVKNNLVQNVITNETNSIYLQDTPGYNELDVYGLPNGNFLLYFATGNRGWYYSYDEFVWGINSIDKFKSIGFEKETFREYYKAIRQIVIFNNSNFLLWSGDWSSSCISFYDGSTGFPVGELIPNNSFCAYNGPHILGIPITNPRYIDDLVLLESNLYKIIYKTSPIIYPPIRLNTFTAVDPIIEVLCPISFQTSGAEPFLTISPAGATPKEEKQYSAKVWLNEPNAFINRSKTYLSRHFEITPIDNTTVKTGFVKLYLTQPEFDSYNSVSPNQLKLPTGPNDTTGKHNLQIVKYAGTSSTNYGLPDSYVGTETIINPKDIDIIWNGSMWEVGFDVTGFSGFFVSTEFEMPLPLKIESITVKNIGNENELNWQTSKEINTHSFQIERSIDALKFEKIGEIIANNSEKNNYQFIDKSPINYGIIYYRLKMNDLDGSYIYSKIISISTDNQPFSISPNPVNDKVIVNFTKNESYLNSTCKLVNNLGQVIREFKFTKSNFEIDSSNLPAGIYYLVLMDGNKVKFIKK